MSNNTNNNCGSCPPVIPVTPVAPPPVCPTADCEEYLSSDCITNEVTSACQSSFDNPVDGIEYPVGYHIDNGSTLTEVISQLTSPANCVFTENYLGAMLQYIGNNSLLTSVLCNIIQDCINGCTLQVVDTISFDPVEVSNDGIHEDSYWTTNFYTHVIPPGQPNAGKPDYTYIMEVTDTSVTPPNVYQLTITPAMQVAPYWNPSTYLLSIDFSLSPFNLTLISGGGPTKVSKLPSGHTYETTITSQYAGETCISDSFTLVVPQSPVCPDCEYVISTIFPDPDDVPVGCIYMDITATKGGLPATPFAYSILVTDAITGNAVNTNPIIILTSNPTPACGHDFCLCGLTGTNYVIKITPVCSFDPLYCKGTVKTVAASVVPPSTCAPPDITQITVITPP